MKKLLLAAAVLFVFSTLATAQHSGDHHGQQAGRAAVGKQGAYQGSRGYYPSDRYNYGGRHNDRFPADRYYWHEGYGRHYYRYYQPYHRWVICIDGARYRAYPSACISNGGVLYFW